MHNYFVISGNKSDIIQECMVILSYHSILGDETAHPFFMSNGLRINIRMGVVLGETMERRLGYDIM